MNRFRKQYDQKQAQGDQPSAQRPLREYKDDASQSPPSKLFLRFEVTAYWLLPMLIFCVILFGGIYLAFKFDVFTLESEASISPTAYRGPEGEILVPKLLESHLEAVGGRAALAGIRSARYKGRIKEAAGEFNFQVLKLPPDKGMIMINPGEVGSQKLVLNGGIAWQVVTLGDGTQKILPISEADSLSLAWSLQLHNSFRRLVLDGGVPDFSAREFEFMDRPCYELTKTMPDGSRFTAVLDAENLLLLKSGENAPGREGSDRLEVVYSDHRRVAGIVEAYQTRTYKNGDFYNEVILESIEIDPGLISFLFQVPEEIAEQRLR